MTNLRRSLGLLASAAVLVGCAAHAPPSSVEVSTPAQWYAPLPHGASTERLADWWARFDDPLLTRLVNLSEVASPTLATALSRLRQADASRATAQAALLPSVDGQASLARGFNEQTFSLATTRQVAVQASWELDLFGAARAARDAADARVVSARAGWHDARVSVAAETANQYYALRACELSREIQRSDANSRSETARLTQLSTDAGFTAPASAALARASAAEGKGRLAQQAAQCDVIVKGLVELTALDEPALRRALAERTARLPQSVMLSVPLLPASALAQRPDLQAASRELAAAAADVGAADARRYPSLSLTGSIGRVSLSTEGQTIATNTWSIGPLALSVPIFDAGRRLADRDAATARYLEAAQLYRAKARQAVREVEEALVNLDSAERREGDARAAADGYRASFTAIDARWRGGLASQLELEDARRTQLAAELTQVSVQRERVAAWVALYRAAGGGFTEADLHPQPGTP